MRHSPNQQPPPPDEERRDSYERPFNPSQLLWRIWLLFRRRPRLFQRVDTPPQTQARKRKATRSSKTTTPTAGQIALQLLPIWLGLLVILIVFPGLPWRLVTGAAQWVRGLGQGEATTIEGGPEYAPQGDLQISPIFTQEVAFWAEDIAVWSLTYQIPANFIATVMQIESCGDPTVASPAGASGLFQVMPFHFEPGDEHLDPNTNAKAGLTFLADLMEHTDGDVAKTLAGYNGGGGQIDTPPEFWPSETQRYVYWGTGIYEDVTNGEEESDRLNEWLASGGYVLCQRAAATLGLEVTPFPPTPTPGAGG